MEEMDRIFDLLRDERRRYALYYLEKRDGPVSVDEVAEQVAEWETDTTGSASAETFRDVKTKLCHTDLPKASEVKYVQYNSEEGTVEAVGEPPEFTAITTVAKVIERPDRNP